MNRIVLWSGSYYVASTGGAPIERIKQYIQSQEMPNE
ncbi:MAG: transposase [Iphinoe sp. HA4291-MV1]|nr:transposase [Iphinoe sp. HA4291-MV1]